MPTSVSLSEHARRESCCRLVDELSGRSTPRIAFAHRAAAASTTSVGVLAASYNPPTRAHVRMAEIAHGHHGLEEIVFEMSIANVDKDVAHAPLSERLMMMLSLTEGRDWLSVALGTHARFVDKVSAVRGKVGPAEIVFIVGYDTLVRVFDGKYYEDPPTEIRKLFEASAFLCANRADGGDEAISELLARDAARPFSGRVDRLRLDAYHAGLSASDIRSRLRDDASDPEDVPQTVADYIRANDLYRD